MYLSTVLKKDKRTKFNKQFFNSLRSWPWDILCEECGAVYDQRSLEGLCRYCAEGEEESLGPGSGPKE